MGITTDLARGRLDRMLTVKAQQATIAVGSPNSDRYFWHLTEYDPKQPEKHVEDLLLEKARDHFGSYDKIPNGSTIAITGRWSPCRRCTNTSIPKFIQETGIFARGIRLKYLFAQYYTQANWNANGFAVKPGGASLYWPDAATAQAAYDDESRHFGVAKVVPIPGSESWTGPEEGPIEHLFQDVKVSHYLVYAPYTGQKTSQVAKQQLF